MGTLYLRAAVLRRGQRPLKGLGTELFATNLLLFEHQQKTARKLTVFWDPWRN